MPAGFFWKTGSEHFFFSIKDRPERGARPGHRLVVTVTDTGGGGRGVTGHKKVCVLKIGPQFRAHSIHLISFPRKTFLMWVGGLGQVEEPRLPHPPPQVTLNRPFGLSWKPRFCGSKPPENGVGSGVQAAGRVNMSGKVLAWV